MDKKQNFNISLKEIVPEYYSKNPAVSWLFKKRLSVVLKYVKIINPKSLVDMGCGDGSFIRLLNDNKLKFDELFGIDLNKNVLLLNKNIKNCKFEAKNIEDTKFPSSKFDAVVCLDTLEHIRNVHSALKEDCRILKDGGYLITSEPVESFVYKLLRFILKGTFSNEKGPGAGVHYHNARGIEKLTKHNGFKLISLKKIPFYAPFDLFHINLYQKIEKNEKHK